jgi:hypothetical protein
MSTSEETICLCCGKASATNCCQDCSEELQVIGFELGLHERLRTDALLHAQTLCGWCGREIRVSQSFGFKGDTICHQDCLIEFGVWEWN